MHDDSDPGAIDGLISEADDVAGEVADKRVLDAAVIGAAQSTMRSRVMALCFLADELSRDDVVRLQAAQLLVLFENLQFLEPSHEGMRRSMRLFFALCVFHLVQDFIALVDSRSSLLLARKARRVVEVADDPPVLEMQLRRKIKLNRHAAETPARARGFPDGLSASEHPCANRSSSVK
jgi:hypothetical protein